jgi:hypothetical protein
LSRSPRALALLRDPLARVARGLGVGEVAVGDGRVEFEERGLVVGEEGQL